MKPKTRKLLGATLVGVVTLLALSVGYQCIYQWPQQMQARAQRHSVELWGTEPLEANVVGQSMVRPYPGGPYRTYTFQFTNKYGETAEVQANFWWDKPPPEKVEVWQQFSTGYAKVVGSIDDFSGTGSDSLPYYDGATTRAWSTVGGVAATLAAVIVLCIIALLIYHAVDEHAAERRRSRRLNNDEVNAVAG